MTAVLLLASLASLLVLAMALRNEIAQFVLFFVAGCLTLALVKVYAEIPWWGWLMFAVATAALVVALRLTILRRKP